MSDEPTTEGVLAAAFAGARPELTARLPELAPVREASKALRDVLERLLESCAAAADDPIEAERLKLAGQMMRAAVVGTLSAVRAPEPPPPRDRRREPPRQAEKRSGIPVIGALLGRDPDPRDVAARERDRPREPWRPPPEPIVHTPLLLDQVNAAFEAADRVLAAAQPPPPERVRVPWAEDDDLLDLVQELLAAHHEQDAELAMRHIAHLRDDLALRHDIEAVEFDEENGRFFAYVENTDRADARITTTRPALVASGTVVRRGEVRGPARRAPALREAPADGQETPEQERADDD